jgi:hypothetical protein
MTWTDAERISLRAAVASGVLTVIYDGPPRRQVTYQSLAEMRSLLASMEASVTGSGAGGYKRVGTRKGF